MHQPTTAVLSACLMLVAAGPAPAAGSLSLKRESPVPLFVVPCRELPAKPVIVAGELVGALVGSAPGSLFAVGSLAAWHSYEGRYYFGHLPLLTVPLWTTGAVFGAAGMTCLVGRAARQGGEWRPTLGAAALGGLAALGLSAAACLIPSYPVKYAAAGLSVLVVPVAAVVGYNRSRPPATEESSEHRFLMPHTSYAVERVGDGRQFSVLRLTLVSARF